MKKSIFDPKVKEEVVFRLDKLTETSARQWGTLSPAQMLHHVYLSTKLAEGEMKLPDRSTLLTRTVIRYFILSGMVPSKKRLEKSPPQTLDEINMTKGNIPYDDLNKERSRLKEQWAKLAGMKGLPEKHPLIGKMSKEHWGQQLYSHINYHLTQFGL